MKLSTSTIVLAVAMVAGCSPSVAEKKHQAELKAILSDTTTAETQKFLGGFGPVSTPEKARQCLSTRLSEWRTGKLVHWVGVRPAALQFDKLLDFKIVDVTPEDDNFAATVNLQVELSGGPGMIGGGQTANRQVRYTITKNTGIIMLVD